MAIASLGGRLLDCNDAFCQWAWPGACMNDILESKATIFNLTPKKHLPRVYNSIQTLLCVEPGSHHQEELANSPISFPALPLQQQAEDGRGKKTLQISLMFGADGTREKLCLTLLDSTVTNDDGGNMCKPNLPQASQNDATLKRPGTVPAWILPDEKRYFAFQNSLLNTTG